MNSPDSRYVVRKIVAWRFWSAGGRHGFSAYLECGHERSDLSSVKGVAHEAVCWDCDKESDPGFYKADVGRAKPWQ